MFELDLQVSQWSVIVDVGHTRLRIPWVSRTRTWRRAFFFSLFRRNEFREVLSSASISSEDRWSKTSLSSSGASMVKYLA